jgi:hypothetical protein
MTENNKYIYTLRTCKFSGPGIIPGTCKFFALGIITGTCKFFESGIIPGTCKFFAPGIAWNYCGDWDLVFSDTLSVLAARYLKCGAFIVQRYSL